MFSIQVIVNGVPALITGGVVLTLIVMLSAELQPFVKSVLVTIYVVVDDGFANGLLIIAELKPLEGVHKYVDVISSGSPIVIPEGFNKHVFKNPVPACTTGAFILTMTFTFALATQPFTSDVFVTVYVMLDNGLANGLPIEVALNPVAGNQAYEKPGSDASPINCPVGCKRQVFVKSPPIPVTAGTAIFCVMVRLVVDVPHPFEVMVNVYTPGVVTVREELVLAFSQV